MNNVRFSMMVRGFLVLALVMVAVGCTPKVTLTIDVEPEGAGAVTRSPDRDTYRKGDVVTLTAVPAEGNAFSEWDGDLSGTENPVVVRLDENMQVIARFTVSEPVEGEGEPAEGEPVEGEGEPAEGEDAPPVREGEPDPEQEAPYANFGATPKSGVWPLTVTFTDYSEQGSSEITGWLWDFGDGNKRLDQNVEHVYLEPGVYSVSLTVFSESGEDMHVAENFITVEDAPDTDGDGIPDWLELELGTDPYKWDTSGDGMSDGALYYSGMDPLHSHGATAPETVIVETHPEMVVLEVGEDYLVFEHTSVKQELFAPGGVLVNSSYEYEITLDEETTYYKGFLRRIVSSVEDGNRIIVHTTDAGMQEAWTDLYLETLPEKLGGSGSVTITIDSRETDLQRYLHNYQVYNRGPVTVRTKDGRFLFTPTLSWGVSIKIGKIEQFYVKLDGTALIQVGAEVNVSAAYSPTIPDIKFIKVPIPIPSTPLTMNLSADVGLELKLQGEASVYAGFSSTTYMTVGVEYRNGSMNNLSSVNIDARRIGPTLDVRATAEATIYLKPKLDVSLYGRGGVYAQLNPFLKFQAHYPCTAATAPRLDAGLYAAVGMYVDLFVWEFAPDPITFPNPPITHNFWTGSCGDLTPGGDEGEPVEGERPTEGEPQHEGEPAEGETPMEGEVEPGEELTVTLPGDVPLTLVRIPAGTFMMGRYPGEQNSYSDEDPQHSVTISQDFYMGKYEITQAQWLAVMGSWPGTAPSASYGVGDSYPAYYVSWNDAQNFIAALNTHITSTGQGAAIFRLPTESEWEYACRAGTTTRFYFGDSLGCAADCSDCAAGVLPGNRSDYMWYCGNNSLSGSKPVGGKLPNAFGLYDMSGNLWEWCQDWYGTYPSGSVTDPTGPASGSYRVLRGGYWLSNAADCRAAARGDGNPGDRSYSRGFRVARASD